MRFFNLLHIIGPSLILLSCAADSSIRGPESVAGHLQQSMEQLADDFNGDVGIYVRHLQSGVEIAVNPDDTFPTASMIKVPILGKLFRDMEDGKIGYQDTLVYDPVYSYQYADDMINQMAPGSIVTLSRLIMLMMSVSDNTASIWNQVTAGGGTGINAWLDENGFEVTRVNSRTEGRKEAFREFGWGQTTPREMSEMMVRISDGALVSRAASEKMYRSMSGNMWDGEALSQIPPYVSKVSKQGAVRRSRSESVVVNGPSGDYAFTVITKNQEDERYEFDNEGYVLIRKVSRLLWEAFEPESDWEPDPGYSRFW